MQELLQQGARQSLPDARAFIAGLERVAARHGWHFPGMHTSPALQQAREQIRAGLDQIRQGQEAMRVARECLLEAMILDEINEELEAELRRLLSQINTALHYRVIP